MKGGVQPERAESHLVYLLKIITLRLEDLPEACAPCVSMCVYESLTVCVCECVV